MSHFESVFYGYQIDTILGMTNISNPLDEFLTKPRLYLLHYLQQEPRFDININMAKNGKSGRHQIPFYVYVYVLLNVTIYIFIRKEVEDF